MFFCNKSNWCVFQYVLLTHANPRPIPLNADVVVSTKFKCIFDPKKTEGCLRHELAQPIRWPAARGLGSLEFAKKTCLMNSRYILLCHFMSFLFLTLWKVIYCLTCKSSFEENWSSYIVNVILLLKGFCSMVCANGRPFPWKHRTMESLQLVFSSVLMGICGTDLGKCWARRYIWGYREAISSVSFKKSWVQIL